MFKTLVLYESRYGTTWEAANIISLIMGPSRRYALSHFDESCREFDFIIMGTPIYNGKIHPKLENFLETEKEWLKTKNVALFCTCLNGSEGLRVLRAVEENLGDNVLELGVLGGRLEMDRLNERDYQALKEYISREGLPSQGMDLFRKEEVVDLALRFKDIKDDLLDKMPVEQLRDEVRNFLKDHKTCTLATGFNGRLRATPVEYDYFQGHIYITSEGGEKFANLIFESKVSLAVYDDYVDRNSLSGMQITGQANLVDDQGEYHKLMEIKGISEDVRKSLNVDLNLIRVDVEKIEILKNDFKKQGYSPRQVLHF